MTIIGSVSKTPVPGATYASATCGKCRRKANVVHQYADGNHNPGWACACGHFNVSYVDSNWSTGHYTNTRT